jgi:hypothetical protein
MLLILAATFGIFFSPVILLTWASIVYGERRHSLDQCANRIVANQNAFIGSPDFYGLGIRIGIYLQWLSSVLANALLPGESRSMAGAYAGFSLALLVAVLLLVFHEECAFTVEIIILLNILWGGPTLVLLPFLQYEKKQEASNSGQEENSKVAGTQLSGARGWVRRATGIKVVFYPLLFCLMPITTWFWVRLAIAGEVDFAPSPGGTSFLCFTRVWLASPGPAVIIVTALCLWFVSYPVTILLSVILMAIPRIELLGKFMLLLTPIAAVTAASTLIGFLILPFYQFAVKISRRYPEAWRIDYNASTFTQWYSMTPCRHQPSKH